MISVFGSPQNLRIRKSGLKVFFTGENIRHPPHREWWNCLHNPDYRHNFDLILSFEHLPWTNYVRTPLWFYGYILRALDKWETDADDMDAIVYEHIAQWVRNCNNPDLRMNPERLRAFAMVSSHDAVGSELGNNEFIGIRTEITRFCSSLARVDCAGKLLNNTMELLKIYKNRKTEYLRNYKFNICPENSNNLGYTTEKIFDSIAAGCIPIYAGSEAQVEPEILNPDAFIYYDRKNSHKAKEQITCLLHNPQAYRDFLQIPPFQPHAVDRIFEIYTKLMHKITEISTPPPPQNPLFAAISFLLRKKNSVAMNWRVLPRFVGEYGYVLHT